MQFEDVSLSALIHNDHFFKGALPHLDTIYYPTDAHKTLFSIIKEYGGKYKTRPSKEAIAITITGMPMEESRFEAIKELLMRLQPIDAADGWLMEMGEKWVKERAIHNALLEAISIVDGEDNSERNAAAIPTILTRALAVGFGGTVGHDYFGSAEAQWQTYHDITAKIPFAQQNFNRVTNGGVEKCTLNAIAAGINVGKTACLVDLAAHWIEEGKSVAFFTLEVSETANRRRMDSRLMKLTLGQIKSLEKTQYLSKVSNIQQKTRGQYKVKFLPSQVSHAGHIRHVLNEWRIKDGFIPDVIFVDHLTNMASEILSSNAKSNTNSYFMSVANELRNLGTEFDCPIWTAVQFNRAGQSNEDADMASIGSSIGISETVDFMMGMYANPDFPNQIICKVLKSRYSDMNIFKPWLMDYNKDLQMITDPTQSPNTGGNSAVEQAARNSKSPSVNPETGEIFNYQGRTPPTAKPQADVSGWNFG